MHWSLTSPLPLHCRHNDHGGVSNHQPHGCLLNRLFRRRSKKTSKLCVTGLCAGNSPGPVNSPHKGPVTRKMFPFDDVIMHLSHRFITYRFSCQISQPTLTASLHPPEQVWCFVPQGTPPATTRVTSTNPSWNQEVLLWSCKAPHRWLSATSHRYMKFIALRTDPTLGI